VLASQAVSQQIPILPHCGYVLLAADRWLSASEDEKLNRNALVRLVEQPVDIAPEKAIWFLDALAHYGISCIVVGKEAHGSARTKSLVRMTGFEHADVADWEHIYVRTRRARRDEYRRVVKRICDLGDSKIIVLAPFGVSRMVEDRGCATVVASEHVYRGATAPEAEESLKLERYTSVAGDLLPSDDARLGRRLDEHRISLIVLSRSAMGNRRLRVFLAKKGYHRIAFMDGYSILQRVPVATPQ
jgi:hypothetical protein